MIASVTGCSTCRRVFISMNQKPPDSRPDAGGGDELHGAGADIADGARGVGGGTPISARNSAVMPGAGASSITF